MNFMKRHLLFTFVLVAALCLLTSTLTFAQSTTTGEITGTVTDPAGAVVPNAQITLKSVEKGYTQTTTTGASGQYRFSLLAPGRYTVLASAPSFKTTSASQPVAVGATSTVNLKLEIGTAATIVEVTGEAPLLQTENAQIATTMNTLAVQSLPNPGNDLSFIAQTAPGSVMNTQSGYGNFSSYGISATSNLFTINGMFDNDPFLNLNNSGATNLLLGNNEIQEVSVVSNGYSGEYGGFAGATVNYVTKSGGNQFHGNAAYWWNGRAMNANDWFNNNTTPKTPRSFDNANQYATSFGGPIKKNKAFFFVNYEGLRVVIPTSTPVYIPSPAFETATIANLNATGLSQSVPFYQNMFSLYNGAPGASRAQPVAGGCASGGVDPGVIPGGICTETYRSTVSNLTHEYLLAGRFDFNLTNNDKLFTRLQEDSGLQATYTDPINSLFNTQSNQPEYQGQIGWTHSFGPKAVNNLVLSAAFYSAIFTNANSAATLAAFPTTLLMNDGSLSNLGGIDYAFPQGRRVTQYGAVDDFSYNLNPKHTLKLGVTFHRYDITDKDYGLFQSGLVIPFSLNDFYNGGSTGDELLNNFPSSLSQPISIYGLGWYVQDEWRAASNLQLTLALRMDHPSNPVCQTNCFGRFGSSFFNLNHDPSIAYNQVIDTGLHSAAQSFPAIVWQPRFGFAWSPLPSRTTVFRGGFGMFGDTFPGQVADLLSQNMPLYNSFVTSFAPLATTQPGNLFSIAQQSNAALITGFHQGLNLAQISALLPPGVFSPPGVNSANRIKVPMYEEWNFQIEQSFGNNTSFSMNYVGNHGYHETAQFNAVNAYDPTGTFVGLPTVAPDPRFGTVNQVQTNAVSNYNGLTVSLQHRFDHGLQLQASFTWSHALDEISNGGFNPFNADTNGSLLYPTNDNNLLANYGNADYDTRLYGSISYVYQVPYKFGPKPLLDGWQVSGTLFTRSGLPYTVTDGGTSSTLAGTGYGSTLYANYSGAAQPTCGTGAASASPGGELKPCLLAADFTSAATGYGAQGRNQFYGPGYFDTDMTVMKFTSLPHWEHGKLGLGVQFFNILNHPNFDQPDRNIAHTSTFGQITRTLNTPTSILGSFLGGDASPRLIQLTAKFNF